MIQSTTSAHETPESESGLRRTMTSRHLVMIALGGVIGSGLFVSSGYTISQAGPLGAVLAYAVGALVAYMVMSGLGELSARHPVAGGFHAHATRDLGPAWGFATAWLYWLCWVVALASEFTAAGLLMQRWFPEIPVWVFSLIFAALLYALNATSSRVFGETEFWFALIKVAAVLLVIVVGAATIIGINPASDAGVIGLSNFHTAEGLFPTGITGVLVTILSVFYAFSGTELIGVAAGEAKNPQLSIPRAIRTAVVRLTVFFIGAIVVVAAIIPFAEAGANESPFVTVLDVAGLPAGADIMNFVIITALLSAGNSGLYSCARMLHSMGAAGQAPKALSQTNSRGIPMLALGLSMLGGLVSLFSSFIAAQSLFLALVSIAGFAVVAVWIVICASHLSFRRHYVAVHGSTDSLPYRAPLFPILPVIALVLLGASLIGVGFDPVQRPALYFGVPFTLACLAYYRWRHGSGVFSPQREAEVVGTKSTA
ncbi:amino acid permease [Glutamicibacter halophytocola]|uniref:Amino acid permease n=1 Tax=Glutamicibacter halophytocola TaxID=1933880 RepID=A0AA94XQH3_9MICC|nr:amino acid permease [Glutamicibacter halophytocola]ALG30155.1 amino acid transporter [Glutamicibacter halophytocola]UUX58536.1 amino acid permease [Glutamicibacter halophytocola]